jgi:hypothetical protein
MPVGADASRPVRTVDTNGNTISTDTGKAAPIKTVDTAGRTVQAEAAKVAEKAAVASGKDVLNSPATEGEKPAEKAEGEKDKTPSQAELRKQWLDVQRLKRSLAEKEKRAGENLTRAEAFAQAKALAESGEDPTAILKAAGIDEAAYYQKLTQYALSDKARKPEDPVQKELREHRERLDKYAKDLEVQARTLEEQRALEQHNQAIKDHVIPLLQTNQDRYESLFAEYGPNAAVEVYKTVWEIYQQTGKARKFEEVADEMEAYWTEQVDKGIQAASKLKKFQNRFAQSDSGQGQHVDRSEPRRSVTLSNRAAPAVPPESRPSDSYRGLTKEERVAAILKKFA